MNGFVSFALGCMLVVLIFWILAIGQALLIPLIVAVFAVFLINIVSDLYLRVPLGKKRMPPALAFALSILTGLITLYLIGLAIGNNLAAVVKAAPQYQENVDIILARVYRVLGLEEVPTFREILGQVDLQSFIGEFAGALGNLVGNAGLILVYMLFILLEQRTFFPKLRAIFPDAERSSMAIRIFRRCSADVRLYIGIKTAMSLLTGFASWIVLALVGVDFAAFWGVMIFLLNFIPTIGSIIGAAIPTILAALQFMAWGPFLITGVLLACIQMSIGNLLEPKIMGRSLNLSPLVLLFSLALWGAIWGIAGMFLCVPIMVILTIVLGNFERTRPIAIMLSGDGNWRKD